MDHLVAMSVVGGGGRLYLEVEVPVPDGLEDGETFLPGPAYQQLGLRLLNIAANYRYSFGDTASLTKQQTKGTVGDTASLT